MRLYRRDFQTDRTVHLGFSIAAFCVHSSFRQWYDQRLSFGSAVYRQYLENCLSFSSELKLALSGRDLDKPCPIKLLTNFCDLLLALHHPPGYNRPELWQALRDANLYFHGTRWCLQFQPAYVERNKHTGRSAKRIFHYCTRTLYVFRKRIP